MKQIYVGNLPQGFTTRQLYDLFVDFGRVESVLMADDPKTGEVKDFGFIEMASDEATQNAVKSLNGREVSGRRLRVEESKPKPREEPPPRPSQR